MIRINWLRNPNHVVYGRPEELLPRLAQNLGIPDLAERVDAFRRDPAPTGISVRGKKRTTLRLFIPDLYFSQPVEMGENVWIYTGEINPAYCLLAPREDTRAIS